MFKKLFCNHFWKVEKKEYLRTEVRYFHGIEVIERDIFAVQKRCVKCGKEKVVEAEAYT